MYQTEEVDDDYFTPVASASLANIFDSSSLALERSKNESLKYTPPKHQLGNKQTEDLKATSCVFACVLVGYEWHNSIYSEKGRLGFAFIKFLRTGLHKIILYDSNKTTLSNATITSKLKVNSKSQNYISYYDDHTKYWSLYGKENEIEKIIELLKDLGATITNTESKTKLSPLNEEPIANQENIPKHVGSDTDSSINKKTKASILNRMANMGHSVLPPNTISAVITSDSSDTNSTDHIKTVRHKPIKGITKRNSTDKTIEQQRIVDEHTYQENSIFDKTAEIQSPKTYISDQLVPISHTTIMTSPSANDMNLFISEQRISNSEMRINIGRVHDKVDHIINKINVLEVKGQEETSNVNTEILQKLLREYENKIKIYEELLSKMGTDVNKQSMILLSNNQSNEDEIIKAKTEKLERTIIEKDVEIFSLQNKIHILKDVKDNCDSLQSNVSLLEAELSSNKLALKELNKENEKLSKAMADNAIEKIKSLMNETYQAIATNFENEENYTGESVKKAIASIMKKLTLSALSVTQN